MNPPAAEFEVVVQSSMNTPTSLTRPKSSATIAVMEMTNGSDGVDYLRTKSNGALDQVVSKKSSLRLSNEPIVSTRIHAIPLLMVLVFFILWTASSGTNSGL